MILSRREPIGSTASVGPVALEAIKPYDLDIDKVNYFRPYNKPEVPDFNIGLIVGSSGSGKSTLLSEFGKPSPVQWDERCIADHFDSAKEASEKLHAAGLSSVPAWVLKYDELSTGQKFRADLARQISGGATIDEFTSVVDRNVAISASVSVSRYIRRNNLAGIIFSTCHRDIIGYLNPDWIIDTDAGELFIGEIKPLVWHKKFITQQGVGVLSAT